MENQKLKVIVESYGSKYSIEVPADSFTDDITKKVLTLLKLSGHAGGAVKNAHDEWVREDYEENSTTTTT